RDLGDGARVDRARSPAGLHADGRRRMGALGQRDPSLLVGAHPHRHLDGSGDVAPGLHTHEDVAEHAMKSIGSLAVGAGFFFVTLAMFVQGFLPAMIPESRSKQVSRAVRTDVGDVKWVRYDASDYTPLERVGRGAYIREGCWYCHSQYVRPVTGEDRRWGPVSEAGEYAFDLPHLLSTRRIGPDLTRVGLKYGDDWHYAHHWDPRLVVPDSIMPSFKWLYTQVRVPLLKTDAGPTLAPAQELVGLVRYIQKLGTNRGAWREVFEPQTVGFSVMTIPRSQDLSTLGREVYNSRCVGCHGKGGDGNGLAATFLSPRPRNFTLGV